MHNTKFTFVPWAKIFLISLSLQNSGLNRAGRRTEIVLGLKGMLKHPEMHPWDLKLLSITVAAIQPQSQDSSSQLILRRNPLHDAD